MTGSRPVKAPVSPLATDRLALQPLGIDHAVLTGGFSEAELREAGAVDVFESLVDLREGLDSTPLR